MDKFKIRKKRALVSPSRPYPHPFIYLLLILPFGAESGYLSVTLAYQLTHAGVSTVQVASLIAIYLLPHTWKFLWASIIDTTLTRKAWYVIGAILTGLGFLACVLLPITGPGVKMLSLVVFLMSLATTFLGMSVEALMAYHTPHEAKGRAGGWFQAGNLGGSGLGGGLGLWLAQHSSAPWMAGAFLAGCTLLCALPLLLIDEPPKYEAQGKSYNQGSALTHQWANLMRVLKDIWILLRSSSGFLALMVLFLPIGTGAASSLWASTAEVWHANADTIALINGTLGGLISIPGCLLGGYLCDRMDRKFAYLLFGSIQAVCAVFMGMAPRAEDIFIVFTLAYALTSGLTFAAFTALVLDVINPDAAATQYNIFASLANMPIAYMVVLNGWVYDSRGASAMLYTEATLALVAAVVAATTIALVRRRREGPALGSNSFITF